MIDQFANLEDGDALLPTVPLDLSARMRELRARRGLKQSELARRIGLDPSIPSLWEQGKRLVPANRVRSLAQALEVTIEELLDGVNGAPRPRSVDDLADDPAGRGRADQPLLRLLTQVAEEPVEEPPEEPPLPWVIAERPPLVGWIPDGWQPSDDRVQDISPMLPDGYWLDPVRLEKVSARQLLKARLCPADQQLVDDAEVPGAAMAERIYRHCSREEGFLSIGAGMPLIEAIFRLVLASEFGGLIDETLIGYLQAWPGAVPLTPALLRRLRDSVRPYPIRRVDGDLFGGR